jgi:hypothetical protein
VLEPGWHADGVAGRGAIPCCRRWVAKDQSRLSCGGGEQVVACLASFWSPVCDCPLPEPEVVMKAVTASCAARRSDRRLQEFASVPEQASTTGSERPRCGAADPVFRGSAAVGCDYSRPSKPRVAGSSPAGGRNALRAGLRKLFSGASLRHPLAFSSRTQNEARKPGLNEGWCGRGDSNPHVLANASPSSWCVCQFRHFRKGEVSCRRAQDATSVARRAAAPEPAARALVPASSALSQASMPARSPAWAPAESRQPIRCRAGRLPPGPAHQS